MAMHRFTGWAEVQVQNGGTAQLSAAGSVQGQFSYVGPAAVTQVRKPESQKQQEEQKERSQYYAVPTTTAGCQSRHPENTQPHNMLLRGATAKHR